MIGKTDLMGSAYAYVGLGSNVGDRIGALRTAVSAIGSVPLGRVRRVSSVWETEAHVLPGTPPQPDHLNAVVEVVTMSTPDRLLSQLHAIERAAGRDPEAPRWAPRPLDLDLLLFGTVVLDADGLTLPHPRIAARRFVLAPLAELAPDRVVPGLDRTVAELLAATPDTADVRRTDLDLLG